MEDVPLEEEYPQPDQQEQFPGFASRTLPVFASTFDRHAADFDVLTSSDVAFQGMEQIDGESLQELAF